MNGYAALLSAVLPASLCVMITGTIALHLYQRGKIWTQYDDVFKGHFNASGMKDFKKAQKGVIFYYGLYSMI